MVVGGLGAGWEVIVGGCIEKNDRSAKLIVPCCQALSRREVGQGTPARGTPGTSKGNQALTELIGFTSLPNNR